LQPLSTAAATGCSKHTNWAGFYLRYSKGQRALFIATRLGQQDEFLEVCEKLKAEKERKAKASGDEKAGVRPAVFQGWLTKGKCRAADLPYRKMYDSDGPPPRLNHGKGFRAAPGGALKALMSVRNSHRTPPEPDAR